MYLPGPCQWHLWGESQRLVDVVPPLSLCPHLLYSETSPSFTVLEAILGKFWVFGYWTVQLHHWRSAVPRDVCSELLLSSVATWPSRSLALPSHHETFLVGEYPLSSAVRLCPPSALPGCSWLPWSFVGQQLLHREAGLQVNPCLSAVLNPTVWVTKMNDPFPLLTPI